MHFYPPTSRYGSIEERLLEQPKHRVFPRLMSLCTHLSVYQFQIVSFNFVTCNFSVYVIISNLIRYKAVNVMKMG